MKKPKKGVAKEDIKNVLISSGWPTTDVEEAFRMIYLTPQKSKKLLSLILIILVAVGLLAGGGVFAYFYYF